ncbi:Iron-sulfur cluster-binding protein [hydrothermal vent metagenome]|uniref:Iron-sulfur cluster-binding protein n=1 Tax=hydrothermal vent metagenome TaxID=652676 RepID=A0A3B0RYC7_9ZZZZ
MAKRLILCDCLGTQAIDSALIEKQCGLACSRVHSALCTTGIKDAAKEIEQGGAIIACLQERELFEELADELEVEAPNFIDIRDRAGWTDAGANAAPKMAALINDAQMETPGFKMIDVVSEGRCLILGDAALAPEAAEQLAEALSVTVLLETPPEDLLDRRFDVIAGRLKQASGTMGAFALTIDALQQLNPGGRGAFGLSDPRDGGQSECDLILDLSGGTALFGDHGRDGYLRADPRDPPAVARAIFDAAQLVGSFERPLYLKLQDHLCAHSKAGITGCTNCIDHCSTGAISPDGDHVSVDPMICDGCGDCVALCPSGAIEFEAPPTAHLFKRIQGFAETYLNAGGAEPKLLVCDRHGSEMISLAARFDRGLPADVIPLELESVVVFGHAEMLAALACGFTHVDILRKPKADMTTLTRESALANAIAGEAQVRLLQPDTPDDLCDVLYAPRGAVAGVTPILPQGSRRQVARLAAKALRGNDTVIDLPEAAPYGRVEINTDACTLCLSCVSLCPSGALGDNPELPQLRFQEDACLQCGLCTRVCPEKALTLVPQLDLTDQALAQEVIHEEEPFACIECGALFGVKSTVEKITEKLAGKHEMFASGDAAKLIQMCDDCRVKTQYHSDDLPMRGADRPKVVTTEDYFSKRRDH